MHAFNSRHRTHGATAGTPRHIGDLGNVQADEDGVVNFHFCFPAVSLDGHLGILGRSLVIHANTDDVGTLNTTASLATGSSGARLTCAIIERA